MGKRYRKITIYQEYFALFYVEQNTKVQGKIDYVFEVIETSEKVPNKFLKHIENTQGLYEIRIEYQSNIYRVFCCFDQEKLVILFNAFQKKTQKTPKKEIDLAIKLKNEYFNTKK